MARKFLINLLSFSIYGYLKTKRTLCNVFTVPLTGIIEPRAFIWIFKCILIILLYIFLHRFLSSVAWIKDNFSNNNKIKNTINLSTFLSLTFHFVLKWASYRFIYLPGMWSDVHSKRITNLRLNKLRLKKFRKLYFLAFRLTNKINHS